MIHAYSYLLLMKRAFYTLLMILLFIMVSCGLYLSAIYSLVYYKIVPRYQVIPFTDLTMSVEAYMLVALIGAIIGYFMAKKWWQIIYVDKVYYFDTVPTTKSGRRVIKKRSPEEK